MKTLTLLDAAGPAQKNQRHKSRRIWTLGTPRNTSSEELSGLFGVCYTPNRTFQQAMFLP
jgi:hypothetical protein